jgi:hypothetical protein
VADRFSFARGVIFGIPVFDQICQRGGAAPSEVQDAAMRRRFGGEPGAVSLRAVIFDARKA